MAAIVSLTESERRMRTTYFQTYRTARTALTNKSLPSIFSLFTIHIHNSHLKAGPQQ